MAPRYRQILLYCQHDFLKYTIVLSVPARGQRAWRSVEHIPPSIQPPKMQRGYGCKPSFARVSDLESNNGFLFQQGTISNLTVILVISAHYNNFGLIPLGGCSDVISLTNTQLFSSHPANCITQLVLQRKKAPPQWTRWQV